MDPKQPKEISFKPLTDGLGINHFSDGLPYTSHSQDGKRKAMPQFQFPPPRVPKKSEPEKQEPVPHVAQPAPVAPVVTAASRVASLIFDILFVLMATAVVIGVGLALSGINARMILQSPAATHIAYAMLGVIAVGYFLIKVTMKGVRQWA